MNTPEKDDEWVTIILGGLIAYFFISFVGITFIPDLLVYFVNHFLLSAFIYFLVVFLIVLLVLIIKKNKAKRKRPRHSSGIQSNENLLVNWDEIKAQVKARDGNKCSKCGSTRNLHIHHIISVSKGGTNDISNLQIVCKNCHKLLHPRMR